MEHSNKWKPKRIKTYPLDLLGQEIPIPLVLPFLKDSFHEDLEKAFIVGTSSRAKAILKPTLYAEVVFHERALPHLLNYSAVMVAKEVTGVRGDVCMVEFDY